MKNSGTIAAIFLALILVVGIVYLVTTPELASAEQPPPPLPVMAGGEITYTISIGNLGPSRVASGVEITSTNPSSGTLETLTSDMYGWNCSPIGSVPYVTCYLMNRFVRPGTITITAFVDDLEVGTVITTDISISSSTEDPDMLNNQAQLSWIVSQKAKADLYITAGQ